MIVEDINKHLNDKEFLCSVKFLKLIFSENTLDDDYYDDKEKSFRLWHIMFGKEELGTTYNRIRLTSELSNPKIKVTIENFEEKLPEIKKEIDKKPTKEKNKLNKIVVKIQNKKLLTTEEVSDFSWVWYEIYQNIKFIPLLKPLEKTLKQIKEIFENEINKYLDNFINNKLAITNKNYYTFEKQKQILMKLIEEENQIKLYGRNFIIREEVNDDCILKRLPDLALGQTIYALEKMDYLEVVNVWDEKEYSENSFSGDTYKTYLHINIILKDLFIEELNENFREDNPKMYFEKYDKNKKILRIANKNISLAKKGKDTDDIKLLETLLSNKDKIWFNDEILDDWGYHIDEKITKNKVYSSARNLQKKIKHVTNIDDFIEFTTAEFKINPRYLKVDE